MNFWAERVPVKELEEILFSPDESGNFFKIKKLLYKPLHTKLIEFIRAHKGEFTWTHHKIVGIEPTVIVHKLNIDQQDKPVK